MENIKTKTEEVVTGEVEMNQRMADRVSQIDKQTYWYLIQLLELDVDEAMVKEQIDKGLLDIGLLLEPVDMEKSM